MARNGVYLNRPPQKTDSLTSSSINSKAFTFTLTANIVQKVREEFEIKTRMYMKEYRTLTTGRRTTAFESMIDANLKQFNLSMTEVIIHIAKDECAGLQTAAHSKQKLIFN